ncbi:hypothetical protein [Xanthomonas hortorum]|uniref:hypothetical protein n=1 Tax=Xanthomonas hortorum TaxID=56454 RepID=UPI0021155491|nr:hypothetical protein [Xanthomonas hortorum]UUF02338.1 hypothetical protein NDY25_21175 [Xanthomonas hortorum pv. pelargonii]
MNLLHSQRSFDSLFASTGNQQQRDFGTDSYALYGEATLPLGEAFKLTGGCATRAIARPIAGCIASAAALSATAAGLATIT